jgi:UrcA family protein
MGVTTVHDSIRTFAAAIVLTALSLGAHADASHPANVKARGVVHYGDLNLEVGKDARIMLQRIERAAKRACGGPAPFSGYTGSLDPAFEECRDEAIERAVKQLGAPEVTRIYSSTKRRESWLR